MSSHSIRLSSRCRLLLSSSLLCGVVFLSPNLALAQDAPETPAETLPPAGRAALRAGVVGNWIDNIHVFLPLTALAPAMLVLAVMAAGLTPRAMRRRLPIWLL